MPTTVVLQKCGEYERNSVKEAVQNIIESLGGISNFVKPGETVLLKPNMLMGAKPEKAVTTHPEIVRAVAQIVIGAGGKPFIGDSPAVPGFNGIKKKSGLGEVGDDLGIECIALRDSAEYKFDDKKIFRFLEISKRVMETDKVINLPKLKTHSQMLITLGVKNIFGCVVGARKSQWHLRAGIDRIFFARMLVELYQAVAPCLTIIDAVVGMEGNGPGPLGKPRKVGLIAGSLDAVALDRVIIEIVGAKPDNVFTYLAALEMKVGETDLGNIEITGEAIETFAISDYDFPKMLGMMPVPNVLRKFMTNQLTSKPKEDLDKCTLCNQCMDICPTDVITSDEKKLSFDYDKCIRCFCCVEVCPEGAMKPRVPWLLKLVG